LIYTLFFTISLLGPAHAQTYITSVGSDQAPSGTDIGGMNWIRIFNNLEDGGWWLAHHWDDGSGPGYNVAPMTTDFFLDTSHRIRLAEWPDTKDHAIARCPDGSFLHAYSIGVENASARSARYDANWSTVAEGWIEEGVDERAHNDLPIICSSPLQAVAFTNHSDFSATVFEIDAEANPTIAGTFSGSDHISGASWTYVESRDQYLIISNSNPGLKSAWYNRDFSLAESTDFVVEPALERHFWPQGLMRVGDKWVLTFLGVEYREQYLADDGDVYVAVLNDSFETLEVHKVSENEDGGLGSARPSFARHGSDLVVVWDKAILPRLAKLELNLSAFGVTDDDTGFTSTGGDGSGDDDGSYDPCTEEPPDTSGGAHTEGETETTTGTGQGDEKVDTTHVDGEHVDTAEKMSGDCAKKGCQCSSSVHVPWGGWLAMVLVGGLAARRRT